MNYCTTSGNWSCCITAVWPAGARDSVMLKPSAGSCPVQFGAVPLVIPLSPFPAVVITPGEAPSYACASGITCSLFPPFCSSCDSCSTKWLWQQPPHKQPSYTVTGTQAASQRVKWREACQLRQNSEQFFLFYKHKTIEWKELYFYFISPEMSVFYIDMCAHFIKKHNPVILTWKHG